VYNPSRFAAAARDLEGIVAHVGARDVSDRGTPREQRRDQIESSILHLGDESGECFFAHRGLHTSRRAERRSSAEHGNTGAACRGLVIAAHRTFKHSTLG
jgi:hypothetical protein